MSLRFDPRLLISGAFKTCPNCGAEEFGILGVGHEMYTRRCRACWFKAHVGLPPLSRKVVYIDQFAISDMMKMLPIYGTSKTMRIQRLSSAYIRFTASQRRSSPFTNTTGLVVNAIKRRESRNDSVGSKTHVSSFSRLA
jgi:hypothetical protein